MKARKGRTQRQNKGSETSLRGKIRAVNGEIPLKIERSGLRWGSLLRLSLYASTYAVIL